MTIQSIINEAQAEYDNEYRTKILNIVTNKVGVLKYYTVRNKEYFTNRRYDEYNGTMKQKYIKKIPPRKFYTETQVYNYARYINKIAGRTLEDDEMNLLLKTISRGRQYELVCVIDRTKEFEGQTVWQDNI